jgi:biopolymer transport protein ExbD
MRARQHGAEEELEFQIAPMIDVLLVILVFFIMITSASVLQGDPDIELPVAADATKPEKSKAEAVLNLHFKDKAGWVTMDKVTYSKLDALSKKLDAMSKGKKNFRVVIRADRTLPAMFVQKVLGACADAGVSDTVFTAINHD